MAERTNKKNPGGRPRKPESEKVVRTQIVLPPKTLKKGKADAKRKKLSFSALVAQLIDES